jgi:hypothetical protein
MESPRASIRHSANGMPLFDNSLEAADFRTPYDLLVEAEEYDDYDKIDAGELGQIPVDALMILCRFLIPSNNPLTPSTWRTAARRLCALSHQLQVEGIGNLSLADLAKALGCGRANLSLLCCEIRDEASLSHRAGKSPEARKRYGDRAREVWSRRNKTAKAAKERAAVQKVCKKAALE